MESRLVFKLPGGGIACDIVHGHWSKAVRSTEMNVDSECTSLNVHSEMNVDSLAKRGIECHSQQLHGSLEE